MSWKKLDDINVYTLSFMFPITDEKIYLQQYLTREQIETVSIEQFKDAISEAETSYEKYLHQTILDRFQNAFYKPGFLEVKYQDRGFDILVTYNEYHLAETIKINDITITVIYDEDDSVNVIIVKKKGSNDKQRYRRHSVLGIIDRVICLMRTDKNCKLK